MSGIPALDSIDDVLRLASGRDDRHVTAVAPPPGGLTRLTHATCATQARLLSEQLASLGIERGAVVGLIGPNCIEWLVAELAILSCGGVPCPLPGEMVDGGGLQPLMDRYGMRACLAVHMRHRHDASAKPLSGFPGIECIRGSVHRVSPPLWPETFALAVSSGTSGSFKCLQMSWAGIRHTMTLSARAWHLSNRDDILLFLPLYNMQQRTLSYLAMAAGCDLTIAQPQAAFRALATRPITIIVAPPAFYESACRQCDDGPGGLRRLFGASIRLMFVGSAPVSLRLIESYRTAGLPLFQVYGINEFGWIAFNLPEKENREAAGCLVEGVDVDRGCAPELVVRGSAPQSHAYYVDGVERARSVYVAPKTIATGDLGTVRDDGTVYLTGRRDNLIVTQAGHKIAPEWLEREIEGADARIQKAFVYVREGHDLLECALWTHERADESTSSALRHAVEAVTRGHAPHERVSVVTLRSGGELTSESGLLTKYGKPNRAAMLASLLSAGDGGSAV